MLVAVYAVFALAAGARATVQLLTAAGRAPVAYALSAAAAAIYLVAAFALARGARRVALVAISIELAGVVLVGAATAADPAPFGDETVWSRFGAGYGYVRARAAGARPRLARPAGVSSPAGAMTRASKGWRPRCRSARPSPALAAPRR